ncbi:MAG: DUF4127 family protein [Candidatus Gastranaerophilaceae bacterium]
MKIALIPIDNRPVCYNLPKEIVAIDNSLELFLPDRKLLGGLRSAADVEGILDWLAGLKKVDAVIVSLDTIAYGGLIPSRRCKNSAEDIKLRLDKFKGRLKNKCKKVYAFSSIMRISNNNFNEEEKEYWNKYGKKIFEYSYNFHKEGAETDDIPEEILSDYLATRQRNFEINKMYLGWLKDNIFDTLVFSKDDCAEYGLNVLEAEVLKRMIKEKNLTAPNKSAPSKSVYVKAGADEIPLTLLALAVCDFNKAVPKISPKFLAPEHKDLISNYEDISIEKSTFAQLELSGCRISDEKDSDLVLLVNNFEEKQGEIVMKVKTKSFSGKLSLPEKPYMIADVRFANGADNKFAQTLLKNLEKNGIGPDFYGYSAWNTSANTLGSLICTGVVKFFTKKKDFNEEAFKKLHITKFLDDWAYQANVRQILTGKGKENRPDVRSLKKLMTPYEKRLDKILEIKPQIKYKFPWKRFFEVEVIVK